MTPSKPPPTPPLRHSVAVWWHYTSQVLSIIGIVGILDNLKTWVKLWNWILEAASSFSPSLEASIRGMLSAVHWLSITWRQFLHPIVDFLLAWLPFSVPPLFKDILLIAVFVSVGWSRAEEVWSETLPKERQRIQDIAIKYAESAKIPARLTYIEVSSYLKHFRSDRDFLSKYEISNLLKLEKAFSDRAHEFAIDVFTDPEVSRRRAEQESAWSTSNTLKSIVTISAIFVSLFLLFDYIYFLRACA